MDETTTTTTFEEHQPPTTKGKLTFSSSISDYPPPPATIPFDVIANILLKLPVKSLLRFTGKFKELPRVGQANSITYGFGYDHVSDSYKVVAILNHGWIPYYVVRFHKVFRICMAPICVSENGDEKLLENLGDLVVYNSRIESFKDVEVGYSKVPFLQT
ncbi:hypothetical protein PIB30_029443 [Stylosanthes scabra]|uniref:F-box domain-containing protein n=1 Tax=Stylosanthes scabra TaxID=79078 RepID=A0ABU6YDI9_9FABA|nr:hypothetical protein [Stylosanthes scabra]